MKIAPLIAIISLVSAAPTFAAFLVENSTGGATDLLVVNSSGSLVSSGYAASGFFSVSDAQVTAAISSGNLQSLFSSFTAIASDNFSSGATTSLGNAIPGLYLSGSISFDPTAYIGKTVYTFITDGTSLGATPTQGYALVSYVGNSALKVVADPDAPATAITYSAAAGDGTLAFGKTGPTTHSDVAGADFATIQLVPIPEPSVALLGLLGVAGLVRRRR